VRRPRRPLLIATLGDSITAGAPLWDPNPAFRRQLGDGVNVQSQYQYWARRRLGPRATFRNCGISGETSDQIAARLDACAAGAQVLIVQGGVNDIARGGEVGETAANLRAMVRRGRHRGLRVAIAEILPWNNGYPDAAPAIDALNRLIATIAHEEGARLLRWHRAIEDPAARGRMRPDWTIEGDHPSVSGYRRLGEAVVLP
jgi:acyl-CoA thioesterase-1